MALPRLEGVTLGQPTKPPESRHSPKHQAHPPLCGSVELRRLAPGNQAAIPYLAVRKTTFPIMPPEGRTSSDCYCSLQIATTLIE